MKRNPPTGGIRPSLITALCGGLLVCLAPQTTPGTEVAHIDPSLLPTPPVEEVEVVVKEVEAVEVEGVAEVEVSPITKTPPEDERPIVIQYSVSHSRNVDQISLVFRQETVDLVVNTDFFQKRTIPRRLGIFGSLYNRELSLLRSRARIYETYHTQMTPSSFLEDVPGFSLVPVSDPFGPRIYIGGKEVPREHALHEILFGIIRSVWDHQWHCVNCAYYRIQDDSIVRTIEPNVWIPDFGISPPDESDKMEGRYSEEFFPSRKGDLKSDLDIDLIPWISRSGESLDCVHSIGHRGITVECVDSTWGIFALDMRVQDTSSALEP